MTFNHRVRLVLGEDGKLSLDHLPFRAGQTVEVTVSPTGETASGPDPALRGKVLQFEQPTAPVAEADWDALS